MKFQFTKNVVAFGKTNFAGDVLEINPEIKDAKTCLREGWIVEVQEVDTAKRVMKRKKKNESI